MRNGQHFPENKTGLTITSYLWIFKAQSDKEGQSYEYGLIGEKILGIKKETMLQDGINYSMPLQHFVSFKHIQLPPWYKFYNPKSYSIRLLPALTKTTALGKTAAMCFNLKSVTAKEIYMFIILFGGTRGYTERPELSGFP